MPINDCTGFVVKLSMHTLSYTREELQQLDLDLLIDMVVDQTENYSKIIAEHGFSSQSAICRNQVIMLHDIIRDKLKEMDR